LWCLPSQKASWNSSSCQEYHDNHKTIGNAIHGLVWSRCIYKHCGNKYGLVIIDDYSRFTWVFFLQDKSETQEVLKKFLRMAQNEFDAKIKKIRSDNGTEFKNTQVEYFLDEEGIKHEFLAPYIPQQNGVAERKNRTLIEVARTMLDEYKTLDQFWMEAINMVCHATNRIYLHKLLKKTSYEFLTGNKPNVSYF
jgi:transposase InsO family protein